MKLQHPCPAAAVFSAADTIGDALFAVLCGCGHNIRMILAHLRKLVTAILAFWLDAITSTTGARRQPELHTKLQT